METYSDFNDLMAELVRETSNPENLMIIETKNRLKIRNDGLKYFDRLIYLVNRKSRANRSECRERREEVLTESFRIAERTSLTSDQVHSIIYETLEEFL